MKNEFQKKYTLIIGCGRLGASLANELSEMNCDVMVVDRDKTAFRKLSPSYEGLTLIGEATDLHVLSEAGIERASTVIAVTNNDNTNILLSQLSKLQFEIPQVICRVYDPERTDAYNEKIIETISPLDLSRKEINKMLKIKNGVI